VGLVSVLLQRFLHDESGRGVGAALIVTGTSLVIIPTIHEVGIKLADVFVRLTKALH
jgi:Flp pilus assembly pilin Flp